MAEIDFDSAEMLRELMRDEMAEINTCLPAEIVSYENGLAVVKPIGTRKLANGEQPLEYPTITKVPVSFPRFSGDTAGVKGVIAAGDKCLLVFCQRAIDEFLGGGDDTRMYDLTDAIAIMGVYPKAGGGHVSNNSDMIMYYKDAYVKITAGGAVEINAPAGITLKTPSTTNEGSLLNQKQITGQEGLSISGVHPDTGTGSRVTGNFETVGGDIKADSVSLKSHVHSGVQSGSSNTGTPVGG